MQKIALRGRDVDRSQAGGGVGLQHGLEGGIGEFEPIVEISVDFGPFRLGHGNP
jgi:hypothetical protein